MDLRSAEAISKWTLGMKRARNETLKHTLLLRTAHGTRIAHKVLGIGLDRGIASMTFPFLTLNIFESCIPLFDILDVIDATFKT